MPIARSPVGAFFEPVGLESRQYGDRPPIRAAGNEARDHIYTLASGDAGQSVWSEGHRIEKDDGAWHGSSSGLTLPGGIDEGGFVVLTGEGAYEGLTAALYSVEGGCFLAYRGIVTEIPDPPVPFTGD